RGPCGVGAGETQQRVDPLAALLDVGLCTPEVEARLLACVAVACLREVARVAGVVHALADQRSGISGLERRAPQLDLLLRREQIGERGLHVAGEAQRERGGGGLRGLELGARGGPART